MTLFVSVQPAVAAWTQTDVGTKAGINGWVVTIVSSRKDSATPTLVSQPSTSK